MKALILALLTIGLAGCATDRAAKEPAPGGPDANAPFAKQLKAAEGETFEARVDTRVQKEVKGEDSPRETEATRAPASGAGPGWDSGVGEGRIRRAEAGLGAEFWVFASIGAALLFYLIWLLAHPPAERSVRPAVRVRY